MAGRCVATSSDGPWNVHSPGSVTFADWVVRSDRSLTVYQVLFHIACFMIVLRTILK
jgi:hypothetical protein